MILGIESDDLKRCLCDAHCDKEIVKRVCSCYSEQKTREVKRLLYQERKQIADKVCREIENGDIVLMHDIFQSSQEAALDIIDRLTAEGWQFVTADELMVD